MALPAQDARVAPDLEREVTCFICTDILYQPLTLLDCLHTFCGSCLKEWFSWQAAAYESAPTPPPPNTPVFTCPACRAAVRDAVHNANAVRLLDIFLALNPDKGRTQAEKDELGKKYTPGESVLPKLRREGTPERERLEAEERRLIREVRELSLREAVAESAVSHGGQRRRREDGTSRSPAARSHRSRDPSRESDQEGQNRRRQGTDSGGRGHATLQPDTATTERRHRRSESSQHAQEGHEATRSRHVEHQSSLRSLLSATNLDSVDMEREIEEFARQIQEEGLLDGLDLDNIDLTNNEELSRKITESYRRRQRERSSQRPARRSDASDRSHHTQSEVAGRPVESRRATSRQRAHSSSPRASSQDGERRARPPPNSSTSSRLEVRNEPERRRRRTASSGRSSTTPVISSTASDTHKAPRSQTDLALRSVNGEQRSDHRPAIGETVRSSSSPVIGTLTQSPVIEQTRDAAVAPPNVRPVEQQRQAQSPPAASQPHSHPPPLKTSPPPEPPRLAANFAAVAGRPGHQRQRSKLYNEPNLSCDRCGRDHIEYEIHHNCGICKDGNWNICTRCYREGKGCLHWFGFGYSAWKKWEWARQQAGGELEEPHMLSACRYLAPRASPGGADGRRTMTNEDPQERLQSGTFCARCSAWTNDCYWRCDVCNEGDWGFCNDCVNQHKSCTHPLLPLARQPNSPRIGSSPSASPPRSPTTSQPPTAAFLSSPNAVSFGTFRPLVFNCLCEVCRRAIQPAESRYHCPVCPSALAFPSSRPGDYNTCQGCYHGLVHTGQISPENGHAGWRRCPRGHRMVVVAFQDGKGGLWRYVMRDLVGGRGLIIAPYAADGNGETGLQLYSWYDGEIKHQRLAARDVRGTAPILSAPVRAGTDHSVQVIVDAASFPADGGGGRRLVARWAWYPQDGVEDELLFPKGAEIREIDDVNGEWYYGVYMGAKGMFPAPYVWQEKS